MDAQTPQTRKPLRRILGWIAGLAVLALAVLVLLPPVLGVKRYVVTGHSMGSAIPKGSVAFDKEIPVSQLRVGDVITYRPPAGQSSNAFVTHRIVAIGRDRAGRPVFRTKGDANATRDPWRFSLPDATQGKVVFHVPYAGYALGALSLRPVRMLLIGLPALLIAFAALASLWREPRSATPAQSQTQIQEG
jgi:signal peptidase